jgi:hypothetical protein
VRTGWRCVVVGHEETVQLEDQQTLHGRDIPGRHISIESRHLRRRLSIPPHSLFAVDVPLRLRAGSTSMLSSRYLFSTANTQRDTYDFAVS